MKRSSVTPEMKSLLIAARRVAVENDATAALILADIPFDFQDVKKYLEKVRLLIASDKDEVQEAAKEDEIDFVPWWMIHKHATIS
ncbi:MAG: hypothetical protein R3C11_26010 [Planctomycetaceae bacterium]